MSVSEVSKSLRHDDHVDPSCPRVNKLDCRKDRFDGVSVYLVHLHDGAHDYRETPAIGPDEVANMILCAHSQSDPSAAAE